jgi:acyl-CoA reductase-like NAD-dependent aldehyde dehydrogenase
MLLRAIADKLRARQLEYAMMECLNNGKTITEAFEHDVTGAIGQFEYFAGTAFHLRGETADFADSTMLVHREPIGVVAQIIPWNSSTWRYWILTCLLLADSSSCCVYALHAHLSQSCSSAV